MSLNHHLPKKISLAPKRHHFFTFFLFLCGVLLPPIAVAARFGIGKDFFINVFRTICGYFPSHGHNFYIQNIRNNEHRARTPKWAIKAGLVDPEDRLRRERKSQWKKRFDERNNVSTHVGAQLEEGEVGDNYVPEDPREIERRERLRNEGLWTGQDEEYYNEDAAPNQRHWHYPANFEGTVTDSRGAGRGDTGASGGDRWGRSSSRDDTGGGERDPITGAIIGGSNRHSNGYGGGYPTGGRGATDDDVPEWGRDYGSKSKKSKNPLKKTKKNTSTVGGGSGGGGGGGSAWIDDAPMSGGGGGYGGGRGRTGSAGYGDGGYDDLSNGRSGGGYGGSGGYGGRGSATANGGGGGQAKKQSNDPFDHEF